MKGKERLRFFLPFYSFTFLLFKKNGFMENENRPHNYLKIAEESETGKKLKAFLAECSEASEKARAWAEKQGADTYYESPEGFAGGVAMVEFQNTISKKGWTNIQTPTKDGMQSTSLFIPEENSELEKEMMALPIVNETALIAILQFKPKMAKGKEGKEVQLPFSFGNTTPVLFLHHGFFYTDVPYESISDDCQTITEKEFLRRKMAAVNEN